MIAQLALNIFRSIFVNTALPQFLQRITRNSQNYCPSQPEQPVRVEYDPTDFDRAEGYITYVSRPIGIGFNIVLSDGRVGVVDDMVEHNGIFIHNEVFK